VAEGQGSGRAVEWAQTPIVSGSPGWQIEAECYCFRFPKPGFSWIIDEDERGLTAPLSEAQFRIWQQGPFSPVSRRVNRAGS